MRALQLIVIFSFLSLYLFTQKQMHPLFNQYSTEHYPNQKANSVFWDQRGALWASSNEVLFRDDGNTVKKFVPKYDFADEKEVVTSLTYDKKNERIFISYYFTDVIGVFNIKTERYEFIEVESPNPKAFNVKLETFDYNTFYLLKGGGGGMSVYHLEKNTFDHYYNTEHSDSTGIPINYVKSIIPFEEGTYLLGFFHERNFNPGLTIFDPKEGTFEPISLDPFLEDKTEWFKRNVRKGTKIVHFLHRDIIGNVWVGSYIGLFHFDMKNKTVHRVTGLEQGDKIQNADNCLDMAIDHQGYYWVTTPYNGVMVVNPSTYQVTYLKHDPNNKYSLGSNYLTRITKDPSGNLWVGLLEGSFSVFNPYHHSFEVHPWKDMNLDFENRSAQIIPVNQLTISPEGVAIISSGNGLTSYNTNTSEVKKIFQFTKDMFSQVELENIKNNYKNFPFFTQHENKIYFFKNGYPHIVNIDNGALQRIIHKEGVLTHKKDFLPLFSHYGTQGDKVYFFRWNKIESLNINSLEYNEEFRIDSVSKIRENKNRVFANGKWLIHAHKDPNFYVFDPETKKLDTYGREQGFEDSTYLNAYTEGDSVWLCTETGLVSFNEKKGTFYRHNESIGVESEKVVFVIRDDLGDLWVGLSNRVIRWNTVKGQVDVFDEKYGLNPSQFLPGVPQKDAFGNIYIASVNGIIKFNPQNITTYNEDLKINFSSLIVGSDTTYFSLKNPFSEFNTTFSSSDNNLVFEIGNNQLVYEKPHEFHYRLIGQNDEWINNGSSSSIRFPDLSYGNYTLEVKAFNSYGVESDVIRFSFVIQKPFWLSWWFIVLMVLVLAGLVWMIIKARERKIQERNRQLEVTVEERTREVVEKADQISEQKDIIEEKNKEIVDSINYAQRIQSAYLPPEEAFHHNFKNGFVYFKPKDLVSGDFYWFYGKNNDQGEKEVFVAAADCTGHGVPGALMSVICCNAMNETVITRKIEDPGQILDTTRDIVKMSLKSNVNSQYKDGMDISLCKINLATCQVDFAGAHNPLWIVTARSEEVEGARSKNYEDLPYTLWEIKGDKQPIGLYEHEKPFSTHSVHLHEGDRIYMFSDGYQDQFGGEDISDSKKGGKKFKSANFKKLLISLFDRPMEEQKEELHNTFVQWKGDLEQIDDVCVIGVRL